MEPAMMKSTRMTTSSLSLAPYKIIVGEDQRPHLPLQALPVSATVLNSRPILKG
jgi:hypothetical protein